MLLTCSPAPSHLAQQPFLNHPAPPANDGSAHSGLSTALLIIHQENSPPDMAIGQLDAVSFSAEIPAYVCVCVKLTETDQHM